jgi:hypothetical protein
MMGLSLTGTASPVGTRWQRTRQSPGLSIGLIVLTLGLLGAMSQPPLAVARSLVDNVSGVITFLRHHFDLRVRSRFWRKMATVARDIITDMAFTTGY